MRDAKDEADFEAAAARFDALADYRDSEEQKRQCLLRAEAIRKDRIYLKAKQALPYIDSISSYEFIADDLSQIPGWRDADAIAAECRAKAEQMTRRIEEAKNRREAKRLQAEQLEAEQTARRQKRTAIVAAVLCGIVVLLILITLLRG